MSLVRIKLLVYCFSVMCKLKYYFFVKLLLFAATVNLSAQKSLFDDIEVKEGNNYTLEADFSSLIENKYEEVEVDGIFSYTSENGSVRELPVNLELRGKFRRAKCDFPPLKITLKKKSAEQLNFQKEFRSLKLVTHCYADEDGSYEHLYKEHLVYELYGLLNEDSYRTKFINIDFVDTKQGSTQEFSVLIVEDTDQLAYRLGAYETSSLYNLPDDQFNQENLVLVNAFQFMIANSDWSKETVKNVKILKRGKEYILVPYDFDFSGFVNSKFARPNNSLGLFRMKDRAWQGPRLNTNRQFSGSFSSKRDQIEDTILSDQYLNTDQKTELVEFIDSFFNIIDQKKLRSLEVYPFADYINEQKSTVR